MTHAVRTYYEHLDHNGKPCGPLAKFYGTARYGYKTLAQALRYCPEEADVAERHTDGSDDWAGRIVPNAELIVW